MSEPKKMHINIEGGRALPDEHVSSYKPIPESDTDFRTSQSSVHKSKEKISADGAEEKLLEKDQEGKIVRVDMADAKYVVGDHRNGAAKIELDANKKKFTGLTKEELMKYAEDPFWVRLRWFMFVLFWALWLCMLGGAIMIIIQAPKCALPPEKTWYEKGPLVDMSSAETYADIETDLPMFGKYDVAGIFTHNCKDPYEVLEENSACIKDFKEFLAKIKIYSVNVIVDLTANYVSTSHKWFQLSENRSAEYDKYFIWAPAHEFDPEQNTTVPKPPNNWVSTQNTPAWKWSEKRREFYLNQFGGDRADLNFNNTDVVQKFDNVIKTWRAAGADGIRLNNAREMLVNMTLANEVERSGQGAADADHTQYAYWRHRHTSDQPGLQALLAHWAHLAQGSTSEKKNVFTLLEDSGRAELYLSRNVTTLRPPSTRPIDAGAPTAAADIRNRLAQWPAMQLVSKEDGDKELAVLSMLLPATPVLTLSQLGHRENVTDESTALKHMTALRGEYVVQHGYVEVTAVPAHDATLPPLLTCARWKFGHLGYVGMYNPGTAEARANLTVLGHLPPTLAVHHMTSATRAKSNYTKNAAVATDSVLVPAKAALVLSFVVNLDQD